MVRRHVINIFWRIISFISAASSRSCSALLRAVRSLTTTAPTIAPIIALNIADMNGDTKIVTSNYLTILSIPRSQVRSTDRLRYNAERTALGVCASWQYPPVHTGRRISSEAISAASIPWFSTSWAAHSSTNIHRDSGTPRRRIIKSPCDTVIACAISCTITLSRRGGLTKEEMLIVLVSGSVVASLCIPVLSTSDGSPGSTETTRQISLSILKYPITFQVPV